jgi:hypothetical protein
MDLTEFKKPKSKNVLKNEKPLVHERLTERIVVKLLPSEKRTIEEISADTGIKMSPLIRSILKRHDYI